MRLTTGLTDRRVHRLRFERTARLLGRTLISASWAATMSSTWCASGFLARCCPRWAFRSSTLTPRERLTSNSFSVTMDSPERSGSSPNVARLLGAWVTVVCLTAPMAAQDLFGLQTMGPAGQLAVDAFAFEPFDIGAPVRNAPFSADASTEIVQTLSDG